MYAEPEHNEEIEFHRSRRPPRKTSIKKQIKSIIKSHGWAPARLDWKDIKSSMTRNEIEKYGESAQKFIKKYNDKITEMNLRSSKEMPRNYSFNELLSISCFINATPSHDIRKLLKSVDDDALKQMMLNTLSFFLIPKNREKYLNQRHKHSRQHHGVLSIVRNSMSKQTIKYRLNTFDLLPLDLNYHICSFLDPKSVSNVSFTCHSFCKASAEPAARSSTKISANQISLKPQLSMSTVKQCRFIQSLSLNNLQRGYEKKFARIFKELLPNCQNLKSLEMDSISDKLALQVLNVVSERIEARDCDLSALTITALGKGSNTDIPWSLLKNLKTLTVRAQPEFSYSTLRPLWVNGSGGYVSDVHLKHLTLCDLRDIPMISSAEFRVVAHPIYWLFSIPNLESAELGVKLRTHITFGHHCQIMLGKPEMRQAARDQTSFKSLTLNFSNLEGVFDWNAIFTNIRLMYPNLKDIAYNNMPVRSSYRCILSTNLQITPSVDWKVSFGGLKQIELGIGVPIATANCLLTTINQNHHVFQDLEVMSIHPVVH